MTNQDLIFTILTECKNRGHYAPLGKQEPNDRKLALNEAIAFDFMKQDNPYRFTLTKEGFKVLEAGSISKYQELKGSENKTVLNQTTVNADNYVGGDNYGDLSSNKNLNNPTIQNTVHKTIKESNKKSLMEIVAWIIGSIAGLAAIYEFIIKRFI
jgi:hypothetical protein